MALNNEVPSFINKVSLSDRQGHGRLYSCACLYFLILGVFPCHVCASLTAVPGLPPVQQAIDRSALPVERKFVWHLAAAGAAAAARARGFDNPNVSRNSICHVPALWKHERRPLHPARYRPPLRTPLSCLPCQPRFLGGVRRLIPEGAVDPKYIEESMDTPDTGSFMHLHLGIDGKGLDALDIHYSVGLEGGGGGGGSLVAIAAPLIFLIVCKLKRSTASVNM